MNQKTANVIAQAAGWLLFSSLPLLFILNQRGERDIFFMLKEPAYYLFCLSFLSLFFLVNGVLIPHLYLRRRFGAYFGMLALLFLLVFVLRPFDGLMTANQRKFFAKEKPDRFPPDPPDDIVKKEFPGPPPGNRPGHPFPPEGRAAFMKVDIVSVFLFITIVALAMAVQINRQLGLTQKKAIKAEAGRAEAELSFLRAQINPHFLFNTLNNIYTLAVTASPQTAESIMKLSNIMRYVTDDISQEIVPLKLELDCISDFIGLQKLRLGEKASIDYTVTGESGSHRIAPLVLMTFIENAFKYGISKQFPSPVVILISVNGKEIHLFAQNRIFSNGSKITSTGVGITNTRQRLQHLYPGKHRLSVKNTGELFTVNLQIQLS
ncbi:hypothetical protein GS399_08535 [Pedobacter sp. HMF7647]|uniref:Signal transduction histidine kinase internal region domain-containing protein n=1 Tax=Hufsiella arboris TaxID=2695275 RepID=A0A7K1Y8W1_9SPHI|nr:sensor histidine kinase [Hufsiella arboris]MXV51017.1 hypothetical protein [Hufsiella arboris]